MRDFEDVLRAAEAASEVGAELGVLESVEDLGAASQDVVPYDLGDLSRSMATKVAGDRGSVTYDQPPYDEIQHNDETLHHQDGRTADYLLGPLAVNADRYREHIGRRTGEAIDNA